MKKVALKIMSKAKRALRDPLIILVWILFRFKSLLSDRFCLKLMYYSQFEKKLDLTNPQTFSEKIQWLKLNDRNPLYPMIVDKYNGKEYVRGIIGDKHIIPTLGVWNKFDDIDFDSLPNQFVLKCTHDSGSVIICSDKSKFDLKTSRKKLTKALKRNSYPVSREWPYKNLKHRIIAEKYMADESNTDLADYKFFCFDGTPKAMFIATDRPYDTKFDFYDMEFNHLPFTNGHKNANKPIAKPLNWNLMIELAQKLSRDIPHVRVDFYEVNGAVYFGELTFYHYGGLVKFDPEEWDYTLGRWIKLPIATNYSI